LVQIVRFRANAFSKARCTPLVALQTVGFGVYGVTTACNVSQVQALQELVARSSILWRAFSALGEFTFVTALLLRGYRLHKIHRLTEAKIMFHEGLDTLNFAEILRTFKQGFNQKWAFRTYGKVMAAIALLCIIQAIAESRVCWSSKAQIAVYVTFWLVLLLPEYVALGWILVRIRNIDDTASQWQEIALLVLMSGLMRLAHPIALFSLDDHCASLVQYNIAILVQLAILVMVMAITGIAPLWLIWKYASLQLPSARASREPLMETSQGPFAAGWTFDEVVESDWGKRCFRRFLCREFSVENLMFYEDVEEYRRLPDNKRREFGDKMLREYFDDNSPSQLNLDVETSQGTPALVPAVHAFDRAQESILRLLRRDSFLRFSLSKEAQLLAFQTEQLGEMLRSRPNSRASTHLA